MQDVTPPATEPPEAAATATTAPAAPQVPTSVITIEEPAETTEETVAATATPRATSTPAATSTPVPIVTPAIIMSAPTATPPAAESGIEPGISVVNAESDANLRAGPSLDAEIIGTIPLGSELSVTGPAEAEGDALWWPVIVVATGEKATWPTSCSPRLTRNRVPGSADTTPRDRSSRHNRLALSSPPVWEQVASVPGWHGLCIYPSQQPWPVPRIPVTLRTLPHGGPRSAPPSTLFP